MQIKPIVVVVNRVKDWGRVVAGSDDLGTWESVISLRSKGFKSAISVPSVTDLLEWSIESWGDFVVQSSKNQKKKNNHLYLKSVFPVNDMSWAFHLQQFLRRAMIIFRIMMTGAYNVCCNVFVWLFGSYWQYWCNRGPVLGLQRLNQSKEGMELVLWGKLLLF